jgi:hypothetical protein
MLVARDGTYEAGRGLDPRPFLTSTRAINLVALYKALGGDW